MHWNDDAHEALMKAPIFVRAMISRQVEKHVREQGREVVTLADMRHVREKHLKTSSIQVGSGEISADQIEEIVRKSNPKAFADERTYEVKVCGLSDCPRRLYDVQVLAEKMVKVIAKSRVPESVVARVKGPILRHHRLMVSISGCPNSCSQPQIADFGVQGRARPIIGPGDCTNCGNCVRVCREEAVEISSSEPVLDASRCIDCGDCAAVCPTRALIIGELGYSVLAGGKLGRHPQLAQTLFDFANEELLLDCLQTICEIFSDDLKQNERLADAVNRIGVDDIKQRCIGKTKS